MNFDKQIEQIIKREVENPEYYGPYWEASQIVAGITLIERVFSPSVELILTFSITTSSTPAPPAWSEIVDGQGTVILRNASTIVTSVNNFIHITKGNRLSFTMDVGTSVFTVGCFVIFRE